MSYQMSQPVEARQNGGWDQPGESSIEQHPDVKRRPEPRFLYLNSLEVREIPKDL